MDKIARQLTIKYAFLQSTYWIGECVIYNFAAVFLQYKNFNNTNIGLVLSLSAVLSIILQPIVAAFADKSKKVSLRSLVIMLMFIVLASAVVLYIAPESSLLIAGIFVLINTIQFTLNALFNSLAFEYMNVGIPMNYGLARGTASIVFAIASYFIGVFVNLYSAGILLAIFIISYCFLILSAFLFKNKTVDSSGALPAGMETNERHRTSDTAKDQPTAAPSSILGFFLKYKKFSLLLIGVAMMFYSHSMINTYLINIIENVGGNSADLGLSLTISATLELPTMAGFIYIVKKVKCGTLLKISAFFFCIKSMIAWLAPNVAIVYLSQTLQMLAFALFIPASVYYVNSVIEEQDKVKGQSMLGVAMWGVAGGIASLTGGKILDTLGVSYMLLLGTIVSTVGFIIMCLTTENAKV